MPNHDEDVYHERLKKKLGVKPNQFHFPWAIHWVQNFGFSIERSLIYYSIYVCINTQSDQYPLLLIDTISRHGQLIKCIIKIPEFMNNRPLFLVQLYKVTWETSNLTASSDKKCNIFMFSHNDIRADGIPLTVTVNVTVCLHFLSVWFCLF